MCVICDHPRIADLNDDLRTGVPLLRIENQYGVARASLHRHRDAGHHEIAGVQAQDTGEMPVDTPEIVFSASDELEAPDQGYELEAVSLPPVELVEPSELADPVEPVNVAPEVKRPEPVQRPAWRNNPPFSGEFVTQVEQHAQLLGYPALEVGRQVIEAGALGWQQYLAGIWQRGSNLGERQELVAHLQRLEEVADAEVAGLPIPEDMYSPMLDTEQAMARNRRLGLALDDPSIPRREF